MYYSVVNFIISSLFLSLSFINSAFFDYPGNLFSQDQLNKAQKELLPNQEKIVSFLEKSENQYLSNAKLPINSNSIILKASAQNDDFDIESKSAIVMETRTKDVLFNKNADEQSPIASITKLMTTLVFLGTNTDLNKVYQVRSEDIRPGGKSYVYPGEKITVKDLLYLVLIPSSNTAAISLANSTDLTEEEFIAEMNEKAKKFGLEKTFFQEPTGLSDFNVSTPREIAKLASIAFSNELIREISLNKSYQFSTEEGKQRIAYSTDSFLYSPPSNDLTILGGKTGHLEAAGYCFVGRFMSAEGHEVISVVLGSPDLNGRFSDTMKIVSWVYDNYEWK